MKKLIFFILTLFILSSCAENYTFEKDGIEVTATPYGWLNKEDKINNVIYKVNIENVIISAIFCETIVVPVILTGTQLYEPIGYNDK